MNTIMFEIGDRVIVLEDFVHDNVSFKKGDKGTVLSAPPRSSLGVRWDDYREELHTLGGRCEDGYGWYFTDADYLAIIDESKDWDTSDMDEYFLSLKCE